MGECPGSRVTWREEGFLGMEEWVGGGARPPPKDEDGVGMPRRGMGRLLLVRLGVGSSVGMRRGEGMEEEEEAPASCGIPLNRFDLLGTGGGGIVVGVGDRAGAGGGGIIFEGVGDRAVVSAGIGCFCCALNEGSAGGRIALCCWRSGVLKCSRLGLISRLGLVGRPGTLGGVGILVGGVGIRDECR